MPEYLKTAGFFVWGFGCAIVGVGCEFAGQGLTYSGQAFMEWADKWLDRAMKVSEWD